MLVKLFLLQRFCAVIDIDDCVGVDCGAGTCVDGVNTQTCDCDVGFTGDNCQTSKLYNNGVFYVHNI